MPPGVLACQIAGAIAQAHDVEDVVDTGPLGAVEAGEEPRVLPSTEVWVQRELLRCVADESFGGDGP